jgi:hypothetical protein
MVGLLKEQELLGTEHLVDVRAAMLHPNLIMNEYEDRSQHNH